MSKKYPDDILKDLEDKTTSTGLLLYAKEYYEGYDVIQTQYSDTTKYFDVKFFLLCHSLELVMKALLRESGATYLELHDYGHDLYALLKALHDKHGITTSLESSLDIQLVNAHYSKKDFEYYVRGSKIVPEIRNLARTTHLLISKATRDIEGPNNTKHHN